MTLTSSEGTLGGRFKLELLFNSSLRNLTRIKTGINPTWQGLNIQCCNRLWWTFGGAHPEDLPCRDGDEALYHGAISVHGAARVTIRGESCIAILDTNAALRLLRGEGRWAVRQYLDWMSGPAQVWFSADGKLAFIISKKTSQLEVVETNFDADGFSGQNGALLDIKAQDPFGFTPFEKTTAEGRELWPSQKLADSLSAWSVDTEPRLLDTVPLSKAAPIMLSSWKMTTARSSMPRLRAWMTVASSRIAITAKTR